MKLNLKAIASVIIPFIGLVSCTANENPTTGPNTPVVTETRSDEWKLPFPELHMIRNGTAVNVPLVAAEAAPVEVDAEIVFPLKNEADFADVELKIKAECQSAGGLKTTTLTLLGKSRFPLLATLPIESFLRTNLKSIESESCRLHFTGTNREGSTHDFDVRWFHLASAERLETVQLTDSSNIPVVAVVPANQAGLLHPLIPASASTSNVLDLVCDHFKNRRELAKGKDPSAVFGDLLNGSIDSAVAAGVAPLIRSMFIAQTCRLFARKRDEATGLINLSASAAFQVRFPDRAESVTSAIDVAPRNDPPRLRFGDSQIFQIVITNSSPVTVAYRFPTEGVEILLQPIFHNYASEHFVAEYQSTIPLAFQIDAPSEVIEGTHERLIQIEPNRRVTLKAILKTDITCIPGPITGYAYRFNQDLILSSYVNWDPEHRELGSEKSIQRPFGPLKGEASGILQGWIPGSDQPFSKSMPGLIFMKNETGDAIACFHGEAPLPGY